MRLLPFDSKLASEFRFLIPKVDWESHIWWNQLAEIIFTSCVVSYASNVMNQESVIFSKNCLKSKSIIISRRCCCCWCCHFGHFSWIYLSCWQEMLVSLWYNPAKLRWQQRNRRKPYQITAKKRALNSDCFLHSGAVFYLRILLPFINSWRILSFRSSISPSFNQYFLICFCLIVISFFLFRPLSWKDGNDDEKVCSR